MKRFDIITEADARRLEPGTTVGLARGGHVTPLAADTLRARRVSVLRGDTDAGEAAALAPASEIRTLAIASDHAGVVLKKAVAAHLRARGIAVHDLGVHTTDPADYPDTAAAVARAVARGEADAGIAIDGAGLGSAIAANKVDGVRAAPCADVTAARYSREHNGANVLALGASLVGADEACRIADVWISTPMREPRYIRRLAKIRRLEEQGPS